MQDILNLIHGYDIYKDFDHSKYVERLSGWNVNPVLYEEIISVKKPDIILELGSWYGASAISMGRIIKEKGLHTKIICVDTWLGSFEFIGWHDSDHNRALIPSYGFPNAYYQFLSNVCRNNLQDVIIPLPNTIKHSCKWLQKHNIQVDVIYIDGDNGASSIYEDIKNSWPLLKDGGIMFGDDFKNPGIKSNILSALTKISNELLVSYKAINKHDNFWKIVKKIQDL